MELTDRKKQILKIVVDGYVGHGGAGELQGHC